MKVIFNITENKNKATFQQEVVKINTSFNQTQNIVKPKFQIGYYPLPVGLENYYTKNETNLLLENYYLKSETYSQNEVDDFLDLKADLSSLGNYYTKLETYSQTEIDNSLATKQNILTNPITGTGTANYFPKFSTTGTIVNSIVYDNGNSVSIGDTVSDARLRVRAQGANATDIVLRVRNSANTADFFYVNGAGEAHVPSGNFTVASSNPQLFFKRGSTSNSSRMQFMTGSTYNFSIGLRGGDSNFHIFDEIAGVDRVVLGTNGVMTVNAGLKDQYGTLKSQRTITITGNTTLSEIHNGAILHITNTCNINIPTGLGDNFSCDCYVKGAFIATFVNGGVTLNSPSGLLLKTDKICTLYSNASDVFNLLGELATS